MRAVWALGGAVTARAVREALATDTAWAYTTVKTMLDRLVEKGALAVSAEGPASLYRPKLSRTRAVSAAVAELVRRAFDGAPAPLAHHLIRRGRLSRRDREELRRLLDEAPDDEAERS
jgi:predicted transcriptional regulator